MKRSIVPTTTNRMDNQGENSNGVSSQKRLDMFVDHGTLPRREGSEYGHFKIRDYVKEMREKDINICFPFPSNNKNEELLPPMDASKGRYWRCEKCLYGNGTVSSLEEIVRISDCCQHRGTCSSNPTNNDMVIDLYNEQDALVQQNENSEKSHSEEEGSHLDYILSVGLPRRKRSVLCRRKRKSMVMNGTSNPSRNAGGSGGRNTIIGIPQRIRSVPDSDDIEFTSSFKLKDGSAIDKGKKPCVKDFPRRESSLVGESSKRTNSTPDPRLEKSLQNLKKRSEIYDAKQRRKMYSPLPAYFQNLDFSIPERNEISRRKESAAHEAMSATELLRQVDPRTQAYMTENSFFDNDSGFSTNGKPGLVEREFFPLSSTLKSGPGESSNRLNSSHVQNDIPVKYWESTPVLPPNNTFSSLFQNADIQRAPSVPSPVAHHRDNPVRIGDVIPGKHKEKRIRGGKYTPGPNKEMKNDQ